MKPYTVTVYTRTGKQRITALARSSADAILAALATWPAARAISARPA